MRSSSSTPTVNSSARSKRARRPSVVPADGLGAWVAIPVITHYRGLRLLTPRGVFQPRSDAGMLIDAARGHIRGEVLDVCTGSGVVALSVAAAADAVTAVDSSRAAVAAVRVAALVNGVAVEVVHGNLFAAVAGRTFDVILSNPPYLPTPPGRPAPGSHAWDGGHDGRAVIDRLCRDAAEHLRPGGDLFMVQSSLADTERSLAMLRRTGLHPAVVLAHRGALGPLARARLGHLRAIGALPDPDGGEEIVVIRARRPLERLVTRSRRAPARACRGRR